MKAYYNVREVEIMSNFDKLDKVFTALDNKQQMETIGGLKKQSKKTANRIIAINTLMTAAEGLYYPTYYKK